ncbi:MAG: nuclear transport factor 2 family protein [Gammaproteobacteria bacterium]|nr:nuclear transport factor 2 family protein [Gammaproteobacteria bacterium]
MTNSYTRWLIPVLVAAGFAGCQSDPGQQAQAPIVASHKTIVDLEKSFASASREHGAKAAFLEFLDEESIVLQPGPTWGRAAWTVNEALPGALDWLPDRAQVSAAGDLGFASGPWILEPRDPEGRRVEGRYVTVWKKGTAGWRVLFDGGFGRKPAGAWEARSREPAMGPFACERGPAVPPGELQLLDLAVSGIQGGETHQQRMLARLDADAWLFHGPTVEGAGESAAREVALAALPVALQYWPMGAGIASSGDLGYSYGLSAPEPGASADASYVHIWCRHGGDWRLALQLRTGLPSG